MNDNPKLSESLLSIVPWNLENNAILVGSSLNLKRNLVRYNFPNKLQGPEVEQVLSILKEAFGKIQTINKSQIYNTRDLSSSDRELICEHFLFLQGFGQAPNASALLVDEKGEILCLFNIGNHFEIRLLNLTSDTESAWNNLLEIENQINKSCEFAFSPKFGYLTADPAQCGTGLEFHIYLHLPALIHANQLTGALANAEQEEIQFLNLLGSSSDYLGDILILQNTYTLGVSEENILHTLQSAATKLIGAEKTMRSHLKEEQNLDIKDQISKAYGLLVHSYHLETKEALDLLSLMKLGLALNYITGVTDQKLSELFMKSHRGHLSTLFPEFKESKEFGPKRADFLKNGLKGISLSKELQ